MRRRRHTYQYIEEPKTSQRRWGFDLELVSDVLYCITMQNVLTAIVRRMEEEALSMTADDLASGSEILVDGTLIQYISFAKKQ